MAIKHIDGILQFTGGDRTNWTAANPVIPDGLVTIEIDTGDVKRGDGVTHYANLPVLMNVKDMVAISEALKNKADKVHTHQMSDISDLQVVKRITAYIPVKADKRTFDLPGTFETLENVDFTVGGVRQYPDVVTLVTPMVATLPEDVPAGTIITVDVWAMVSVNPVP